MGGLRSSVKESTIEVMTVTDLHIDKLNMEGVKKDLDHYWDTYKRSMRITEVCPASRV